MLGVDYSNIKDATECTVWVGDRCIGRIERVEKISVDLESPSRASAVSTIGNMGTGTFKIRNPKKFVYEMFGVKNSYYKHLKRVENRKKLTKKLKKRGRK